MENQATSEKYFERLRSIVDFPIELLVYIFSFLSSRDKVKLRYVSRRLQLLSQTPTIWSDFVWPLYEQREERILTNVLKACGRYTKRLIFPDHVTPSKLFKMLIYCKNIRELHLPPRSKLDLKQVKSIAQKMQVLEKLEVQLSVDCKLLLQIGGRLKELTVHIPQQAHTVCVSYVEEWMSNSFEPQNLNLVILDVYTSETAAFMRHFLDFLRSLAERIYTLPVGYVSYLKLYYRSKVPLNLFPSLPDFQMEFGPTTVLSLIKASKFGITCVPTDVLWYTQSTEGAKAGMILSHTYGTNIELMFNNAVSTSNFVTEIDFGKSDLHSGDLEMLAMACPKLKRLNLEGNSECLKSLQGLSTITQCCSDLCGLNLNKISVTEVESPIKFWRMLSNIVKLTHLVVEICVFKPCSEASDAYFINLFQKCTRLQALELGECYSGPCSACRECKEEWSLLSYFPALQYCRLTGNHSTIVQDIISCCRELTCFMCATRLRLSSAYNHNLQQLYIRTGLGNIPNTFLDTVSAHGKLVHVILVSFSVTVKGIASLIAKSPNLCTLCVFAHVYTDIYDHYENIREFKNTMKRKFPNRKLFTAGTFRLVLEAFTFPPRSMDEFLSKTDLIPLWN